MDINKRKIITEDQFLYLGIPILSLIILLTSEDERCKGSWTNFIGAYLIVTTYTTLLWSGNAYLFYLLKQRYKSIEETTKRIVGLLIVSGIYTLSIFHLLHYIFSVIETGAWSWNHYTADLRTTLVATIIVTFMYECRYFFKEWSKTKLIAEQLKHETTTAQLSNLQNQVNPHFLFNTLNTLSSLIDESNSVAIDFVQHMSHVYRYVLKSQQHALVCLEDELQFAQSYIYLLKARYRDSLIIHFDIQVDTQEFELPPVCLQILLENVIKHNIVSKDHVVDVFIYIKNSRLIIQHKKVPKLHPESGTGTGLKNIYKRYELLGTELPVIENTSNEFKVSLPLLISNI